MIDIIRFRQDRREDIMIAKELMPWLFVSRRSGWTPFAKVRCEGGRCVWTDRRRGGRKVRRAAAAVRA